MNISISKTKFFLISLLLLLIGIIAGATVYHYFYQENISNKTKKTSQIINKNNLEYKFSHLEHQVDLWMYYAHIYYSCLADSQTSLAKREKEDLHQRYIAKVLSTISFIYADKKINQEDNLVLTFLLSQVAHLFEIGKITESDFRDPLGIEWIFRKYPKDSAEKTMPTLTMEYDPSILKNPESYHEFMNWFYNKVIYYKENKDRIEDKHFPYDIIVPENLYNRWHKEYGIKYNAPASPHFK